MHKGPAIALLMIAPFMLSGAMASPRAPKVPILIAHRGASADRPEHTLAAYKLAIDQGADFIEPDLVPTKDGHLVARHENEIGGTTDVADHPEFAGRKTTKTIDGREVTGWFTEDFTLADLKRLRARERLPLLRPANTRFDGQESIPTFQEILDLVAREEKATGRTIGIYPETKHPTYFRNEGLPIEERLILSLKSNGKNKQESAVFIQSFESANLELMHKLTSVRLIQLIAVDGGPSDGSGLTYARMATPDGLRDISKYAAGIGAEKAMVMPRTAKGALGPATTLVTDAHAAGLLVHLWTFRPENYFLPSPLQSGGPPTDHGQAEQEIRAYLATGIDGLFSDSVTVARTAIDSPAAVSE